MQTERITLRPLRFEDGPLFKELDSDPEVMTWLTDGVPSSDAQVMAAVARVMATQEKHLGRFGIWIAHEKASGEYMGWFLFRPDKQDPENTQVIELGYRLKKKFWGQGFASEGSRAFLKLGFEDYEVDEIFATTMLGNTGSQGVMKKIGMHFIHDYLTDEFPGADKRAVRYALKKTDYEKKS